MRQSLSGRLLMLTVIFVMLAEVFIFVPSVARFREDYLINRLERAQIASLAQLATDGIMLDDALQTELLENAEVLNVVLRRDAVRQLVLSVADVPPISATYDLRDASAWALIRDAMMQLFDTEDAHIRVIGQPALDAGLQIEVTMPTAPLRAAMLDYGWRIFLLSTFISVFTAALLFFAVRKLLVQPIKRVVAHMAAFAEDPNDASRIIRPEADVRELRVAEETLESLERQLSSALRQRERLAQLGEAVAKISHDLRNMLSVATLVADRLETSKDPTVQRIAPRLVASLDRAINLTEATLAFGRAEEPAPKLNRVALRDIVEDVIENDRLAEGGDGIDYVCSVAADTIVRADAEQLHRVLSNLVRNARQALAAQGGGGGRIEIGGRDTPDGWCIQVCDSGPGLPKKALDHLFKPFHGGTRKEGTGLGLAICAELVRGHGGRLELSTTGPEGTTFSIFLPSGLAK